MQSTHITDAINLSLAIVLAIAIYILSTPAIKYLYQQYWPGLFGIGKNIFSITVQDLPV